MRQRESKDFAELLNRLREENHTKQDIQKLKQRIISITNHEYPKDAPHVFIQNAKVNDFNARAHNALPGIKYSIKAHDNNLFVRDNNYRQLVSSFTTDRNTCIDHIYTNLSESQIQFQILETCFSDHKTICALVNF